MGGAPRGSQYCFLPRLTFLLSQRTSGKGTEDSKDRWGQPCPTFPSMGFSCSQTEEKPVTHFLLQSDYRNIVFPRVAGTSGGYPRVAPTVLAPCPGKFPLPEGVNQTYVPSQLSGPHVLPEFLGFAAFVKVPKWYLIPLVEYYLYFTEG